MGYLISTCYIFEKSLKKLNYTMKEITTQTHRFTMSKEIKIANHFILAYFSYIAQFFFIHGKIIKQIKKIFSKYIRNLTNTYPIDIF